MESHINSDILHILILSRKKDRNESTYFIKICRRNCDKQSRFVAQASHYNVNTPQGDCL